MMRRAASQLRPAMLVRETNNAAARVGRVRKGLERNVRLPHELVEFAVGLRRVLPARNGRRAPLKRALHFRLVRDHQPLVLHEVRLGLLRGQRRERPRRRERLLPGHRLDPPGKDETRIAGAAPAAGIFDGQADEGVGVDEEQAAHGPRQGRGGPWRPLEGCQGGQGLCPSRIQKQRGRLADAA